MDHVRKAIDILKEGGIVIFPTDTAFGIGCRMDNEAAIEKLYALRHRPEKQPSSVLISDIHMVEQYLKPVPEDVIEKLIKPYWPGALTVILACYKEKIAPFIRGGTDTMSVRIPNHLTTLEIINGAGVPILGPSANFHGNKTPYTFEDLDPELIKLVDYVVPGEVYTKEASTVIDTTVNPWRIVRQGAVDVQV